MAAKKTNPGRITASTSCCCYQDDGRRHWKKNSSLVHLVRVQDFMVSVKTSMAGSSWEHLRVLVLAMCQEEPRTIRASSFHEEPQIEWGTPPGKNAKLRDEDNLFPCLIFHHSTIEQSVDNML
jgi:hypothetical protein